MKELSKNWTVIFFDKSELTSSIVYKSIAKTKN